MQVSGESGFFEGERTPYTEPGVPLEVVRAPDKVLVIGATGHVGRVFLEQGLQLFDTTEFRVLLRNMDNARDMPEDVDCRPGDVCDVQSIRKACEGLTTDSLVFDSVTQIALTEKDEDGSIAAVNLQGVRNVIQVAREIGFTLHKAHSNGGLPCPKAGVITERTEASDSEEEAIYARLPYLNAKKDATRDLLQAQAEGLRAMISYLTSPLGPASRSDSIFNELIRSFVKSRTFYYPDGVSLAYIDVRDAAKAHWVAFMNEIHDDFILSSNAAQEALVQTLENTIRVALRSRPLKLKTVVTIGKIMDFIKKWFLKRASFPVSESTAYLMFANTAYSSEKAREAFGFQARPSVETFSDHFQDLINRDLIEVAREQRALSIW